MFWIQLVYIPYCFGLHFSKAYKLLMIITGARLYRDVCRKSTFVTTILPKIWDSELVTKISILLLNTMFEMPNLHHVNKEWLERRTLKSLAYPVSKNDLQYQFKLWQRHRAFDLFDIHCSASFLGGHSKHGFVSVNPWTMETKHHPRITLGVWLY